uniref:Uncharacterized protein n=1 Tax=Tanacetum cinerariifolium TaxID=118510 RepID=A0A6L2J3D0_TANCI|nr:hypothetical protein [Tanacetum cinerariifolium]
MWSTILTTEPLPTIKEAFIFLLRDESHRTMHFGANDNKKMFYNSYARNPNLACKNYNMTSHTIKRCFELIVYPLNFRKKGVTSQNVTSNVFVIDKDVDVGAGFSSKVPGGGWLGHSVDHVLEVLKDMLDLKGIHASYPCGVCHRAKQTRDPFPLNFITEQGCLNNLIFFDNHWPSEPSDDERDKSDGGATNSSSTDSIVESTSADPTSTTEPYASTSSKGADSSGYSIPELDNTNMLDS